MAHDDHDAHEHAHEPEDRRIRLLHGASPFCWWSYGYEAVLNRARLVYGDQIKVNTYQIPVYEDLDEHNRSYGTDDPKVREEWRQEAAGFMQMPVDPRAVAALPKTSVPGTLAVHAAEAVKPGAGQRLARWIGYLIDVDPQGLDLDDPATYPKLAELCGAPRKQVEQALADGRAEASLKEDSQSMHALGLNFYALQCRDFEGRTVTLEYAFDSAKVEEALEWLARGTLRKQALPPVDQFVADHAPVSLHEVREVFRLDEAKARRAAEPAERGGKVVRKDVAGHTFWLPKELA
jgi:predicted DsbA family dithiol-disulfide isomerase